MAEEMHPVVQLARQAIEVFVKEGKIIEPDKLSPEMTGRAGVFVSLKKHGRLRGCIGTFSPVAPNVAEEIIHNAISSATGDPRFNPVTPAELNELDYSVDILTSPEPIDSKAMLDPKKYGLIVESGSRRGLLLPDLEGVDDIETQIAICRQKAHISTSDPIALYRFQVRRYK